MRQLVSVLFVLLLFPVSLIAETPPKGKAIMVFDASGSMWGQIKGKPKISIAREVVKDVINEWDPNLDLGLTAYGHRTKGDCADIESVIPVSKLDQKKFLGKLEAIKPKGKTPLTDAVVKAAEELKYTEDAATVILISDGIETCDMDPCSVSKKLEEAGVNFTAHVIGFDVSAPEEVAQLKCIADNTGGTFMSASDASSLKKSLGEVVEQFASSVSGIKFWTVRAGTDQRINRSVNWTVKALDSDAEPLKGYASVYHQNLDVGRYKVTAEYKGFSTTSEIEIKAGANKEFPIPIEIGLIKAHAVETAGGEALKVNRWSVFQIDSNGKKKSKVFDYGYNKEQEFLLPLGDYLIEVKKDQAETSKSIKVESGDLREVELVLAKQGKLTLSAVLEEGGEALKVKRWDLFRGTPDPDGKDVQIKNSYNKTPTFTVLPGKYIVQVKKDKITERREFEVVAGEDSKQEIVLQEQGRVTLAAVLEPGGEPLKVKRWDIYESEPNV